MPRSLFRLAAGAAAGYLFAVRPWHLRWGADDREVHAEMPGDDLVPRPQYQATRAVTVEAPPAVVWAWVVRLGGYRPGGASGQAAQDDPAGHRELKVGDVLHPGPDGSGYAVEVIDPPHTLVLALRGPDATTACSISLRDLADGRTRMVFRVRVRAAPTVRGTAHLATTDVGDFVGMRRQMLAVKQGAESAR
ncbi:hypothetical protein ACFQYP_35920 [Nonomuraea antimicrobica]